MVTGRLRAAQRQRSGTLPGQGPQFPPETETPQPCVSCLLPPKGSSRERVSEREGMVPGPQVCWERAPMEFGGWTGKLEWQGEWLWEREHLEFSVGVGG